MDQTIYRKDLDALKGFAILAVVLYHLGILKSGYLGVDLFLVINGFLVIPSICKHVEAGDFSYWDFLKKRIIRLLPLVVIASTVCLIWGFFFLLPDDYENVGEYVVASNVLSGNIMSAISSKNYWAAFNQYKPLMHMWYVGVIFEFYLTIPLFILATSKFFKQAKQNSTKVFSTLLIVLSIVSIVLFFFPRVPGNRFYHIQFRYYEMALGGLIGLNYGKWQFDKNKILATCLTTISNIFLVLIICIGVFTFDVHNTGSPQIVIGGDNAFKDELLLSKNLLLFLTVFFSCIVVGQDNQVSPINKFLLNGKVLPFVGKMSFSIFVWHQIIIAFYRYSISSEITIPFLLVYFAVVFAISYITYRLIEQKIKPTNKAFWITIGADVLVSLVAVLIYLNAGVVRDVPEIDAEVHNAKRGMHIAYCDRVYKYDKDFPTDNDKPNVLVVGNSFSRDMGNIIIESPIYDSINFSYIYKIDESYIDRIKASNKIFIFGAKDDVPSYLWNNIKDGVEVWGIGTKGFGVSNGAIYWKHNRPDYFEQTVPVNPGVVELNKKWKEQWGDNFIDLMELAMVGEDQVRVFTPEHKFISPDCEHLVKGGAVWYASIIDYDAIFGDILELNAKASDQE